MCWNCSCQSFVSCWRVFERPKSGTTQSWSNQGTTDVGAKQKENMFMQCSRSIWSFENTHLIFWPTSACICVYFYVCACVCKVFLILVIKKSAGCNVGVFQISLCDWQTGQKIHQRPVSHLRCQSAGGMQQPFTQSSTLCLQADGIKGASLLIRKAKKTIWPIGWVTELKTHRFTVFRSALLCFAAAFSFSKETSVQFTLVFCYGHFQRCFSDGIFVL